MKIIKATRQYEEWLAARVPVIEADLDEKHRKMSKGLYPFLRATFYRWMQLWPDHCPKLADAPAVLAVGDLHTDNFGTWRDVEGRLIWGVNDFDEAYRLAYPVDLVRLATSAAIALMDDYGWGLPDLCEPIRAGYEQGLQVRGEPFVLAEKHAWLAELATENFRDAEGFWESLAGLPELPEPLPVEVAQAIDGALPQAGLQYRTAHRVAGLGSLGRRRYVAVAEYCRAKAAREAKELTASAVLWALGSEEASEIQYGRILGVIVRCRDPFLQVRGPWVVRRLSPDYTRIDLTEVPERDVPTLLHAMGWETANVHLGSGRQAVRAVREDLNGRDEDWLIKAAKAMLQATTEDWSDWLEEYLPGGGADDDED